MPHRPALMPTKSGVEPQVQWVVVQPHGSVSSAEFNTILSKAFGRNHLQGVPQRLL